MLTLFWSKLKVLLKNPMILFIYGIISKWYIMIMVSAIVVTFWIFTGLSDIGFFAEAERIVSKALRDSKSVARYCVPQITKFSDFWYCLENPPNYEESENEKNLEKGLNDLLDFNKYEDPKNPYAND